MHSQYLVPSLLVFTAPRDELQLLTDAVVPLLAVLPLALLLVVVVALLLAVEALLVVELPVPLAVALLVLLVAVLSDDDAVVLTLAESHVAELLLASTATVYSVVTWLHWSVPHPRKRIVPASFTQMLNVLPDLVAAVLALVTKLVCFWLVCRNSYVTLETLLNVNAMVTPAVACAVPLVE